MTKVKNVAERYEILKAMHKLICSMNDESAYCEWIYLVPDEATTEDLWDIAEDVESFKDSCVLFRDIMKQYGASGFFITFENSVF